MRLYIKHIAVAVVAVFCALTVVAQCSTTVSFDTWLSGSQSTSQNQALNGTVTSVQFNLDFTSTGGEWPADMIVVVNAPNGNCIGGEGYNINPPSNCFNIDFPAYWVTTASGFYTYTMTLPLGQYAMGICVEEWGLVKGTINIKECQGVCFSRFPCL